MKRLNIELLNIKFCDTLKNVGLEDYGWVGFKAWFFINYEQNWFIGCDDCDDVFNEGVLLTKLIDFFNFKSRVGD